MRLVNMLRIFCYLGLQVGCGMAPTSMARPSVQMDEPLKQSPLDLALVPEVRTQAAFLSHITKPMTMPFIAEMPEEPARASMLKFVAKGNSQQAVTALAMSAPMTAMSSATTQCVTLTYDQNGNRLSQTVALMSANSVTWGSGVYGCFVWAP